MIYKIVQGNSFKLHILVQKIDVSREFRRITDFDMSLASDIKVELLGCFLDTISVPIQVAGIQGNVLICDIPSTLELGNYNVRVSWQYEGSNMSSTERNLLRIVGHNSMAHVPVGITDGEHSGFFNLRYYVVTENQSTCPITFITDNIKLSYKDDSDMTETGLESHDVFNTAIKNGASLNLALEPSVGFNIGLVRVVMNGMDITAECFNKDAKKISIPAVSGYVIITASGDANACYYGASSAKDICELNIDTLALTEGDLIGKTVTVGTTEEKPYVWFVSRVESAFFQEGFEASMNSTHIGDLYYYWSDELISGDNTYTIKLK